MTDDPRHPTRTRRPGAGRRQFLRAAGVGAICVAAGCGHGGDGRPERDGDARPAETVTARAGGSLAPTDGFASIDRRLVADDVDVARVTTLDAGGEGSLRHAVTGGDDPRLVVFEVGGVVDLGGDHLDVTAANTYVAGQTAPSPGITVVRGGVTVRAANVVIQHVRVRPGDDLGEIPADAPEGGAVDAMGVGEDASNVVFDHCTATWGSDENMSTGGASTVTFSNNLIAEGLRDSIHPDGAHSYGTLVLDGAKEVAIYGNVWAHNDARHPRLKGDTTSVVVNNVAYNFGRGSMIGGGTAAETLSSIVGNVYRAGSNTDAGDALYRAHDDAYDPRAYFADNATRPEDLVVRDLSVFPVEEPPVWSDGLSALPSEAVAERNLATAGARPADRTPHDERVVASVREGTGTVVDSQDDVGGYPELEPTERPLDVPDADIAGWLAEHAEAVTPRRS